MQPSSFDRLCGELRSHWRKHTGAVALLQDRRGASMRMCAGTRDCGSLRADWCILWRGDAREYEGPLESVELRKRLTASGVCGARITDVLALGGGRPPACSLCFGKADKRCSDCRLRRYGGQENAE